MGYLGMLKNPTGRLLAILDNTLRAVAGILLLELVLLHIRNMSYCIYIMEWGHD